MLSAPKNFQGCLHISPDWTRRMVSASLFFDKGNSQGQHLQVVASRVPCNPFQRIERADAYVKIWAPKLLDCLRVAVCDIAVDAHPVRPRCVHRSNQQGQATQSLDDAGPGICFGLQPFLR
jgi:hypothetical protein